MRLTEENRDLFTLVDDGTWYFAHCIASDLYMGRGIAVPMNELFDLRTQLVSSGESLKHPTCILTGMVFNLITKARSNQKPTSGEFMVALRKMRDLAVEAGVERLAMPRIGCGLDRLDWNVVRGAIGSEFVDTDVEILVCVR